MQIIFKEIDGQFGLFDTRSEKFIPGGRVSNPDESLPLLEIANNLVRKSPRTIYTIVQNWEYIDGDGYTEAMIAEKYLQLNPDLAQKAKDLFNEKPAKKSRKKKEVPLEVDEETGEVIEKVKGKPGRPRRIWTDAEIEAKTNAPKRGRGRPRKVVDPNVVVVQTEKRGRGRPKKVVLEMTV